MLKINCASMIGRYLQSINRPQIWAASPNTTRHGHPNRMLLVVPQFVLSVYKSSKQYGLSFSFDAPQIWNDLPAEVRLASSLPSFRKKLKSYLFAKAFPP